MTRYPSSSGNVCTNRSCEQRIPRIWMLELLRGMAVPATSAPPSGCGNRRRSTRARALPRVPAPAPTRILEKAAKGRANAAFLFPAHDVTSFIRFRAKSNSAFGVFMSFLDEPMQQHHASLGNAEDHACNAAPRQVTADFVQALAERLADRPTGQPNSAVAISSPTIRRSASSNSSSHSRAFQNVP